MTDSPFRSPEFIAAAIMLLPVALVVAVVAGPVVGAGMLVKSARRWRRKR